MLYDHKRWDRPEIKADPFSLESLIAWLETKPPREKYDYGNSLTCMAGQFLRQAGAPPHLYENCSGFELENNFWRGIRWVARGGGNSEFGCDDWTFGAALSRARKALADSAVSIG